MNSMEILGNYCGSADKRLDLKIVLRGWDFTSIYAQFISTIFLQNTHKTPWKTASEIKVVGSLQSTAMAIGFRPPLEKHEKNSVHMMEEQ